MTQPHKNLKTEASHRNDLAAEEFPEGSYGSREILNRSVNTDSLLKTNGESSDKDPANPYSYENWELHKGIPRAYPGEDATNDQ